MPGGASAQEVSACAALDPFDPIPVVHAADVIVLARVGEGEDGITRLEPEVFLKGPATAQPIALDHPSNSPCETAPLADGITVLAVLTTRNDGMIAAWPAVGRVFQLEDGFAISPDGGLLERDLVTAIREVTGQYAVPAGTSGDGISFDLQGNILPVALVVGLIFGVGLVLMRVWHRIDPS